MSKTLMTVRRESQGARGKEKAQSAWRRAHSEKETCIAHGERKKDMGRGGGGCLDGRVFFVNKISYLETSSNFRSRPGRVR